MRESIGEQRAKDEQIVITGAGGFIGGALARYFRGTRFHADSCGRQEAAAGVVSAGAGRGMPEPRLQRRAELPARVRRGRGSLQPGGRHGRHGLHRTVSRRVPAEHSDQHAHDRGGVPRGCSAVLLLLLRLCLQHGPAERPAACGHSRNRTPIRPWPNAAMAGRN